MLRIKLWSFALGILTVGTYHSQPEIDQAQELEIALRLLESHMLCDYSPSTYAQVINNLPRDANAIQSKSDDGGTGTNTVE